MSHQSIIPTSAGADPVNDLTEFIAEYKSYVQKHFKDVAGGENMLQLGVKTRLIQELEKIMVNPLAGLLSAHSNLETAILQTVESMMSFFFQKSIEKKFIKSAFKITKTSNSLSYGVVLSEDTFKNREEVLEFLNLYYTFDIAEKIPVYFQFIPEEMVSAFGKVEHI